MGVRSAAAGASFLIESGDIGEDKEEERGGKEGRS